MTKPTIDLDNLRVAAPCPANWEQMSGNEIVRFCEQCKLNVYDFSAMTTAEITSLLSNGGRVCGRLYRRSDGMILTQDCPVGLRTLRKRLSLRATATFAALMGLCSFAFSQISKSKDADSLEPRAPWTLQEKSPGRDQKPTFTVAVIDPNGALIPGATIKLIDEASKREIVLVTDDRGSGSLRIPSSGTYGITVTALGCNTLTLKHIALKADVSTQVQVRLEIDPNAVTMGILGGSEVLEPIDLTPIRVEPNIRRLLPK